MREKLPYIDLFNFQGLYTKGSPDVVQETQFRVAINTDLFEKYGAISKPKGSKRILNSKFGATISWVGFYKAAALNGQILRHVLMAGGDGIQKINTDGTTTALTGTGKPVTAARTVGLVHVHELVQDFMLIQNQDPDLVGRGDTPLKYDGTDIQLWGVVAPGTQETVQEAFDATSAWTITNGTIVTDSTTTQDGKSVKFSKTSILATNGSIEKTYSTFAVDSTIANRAFVFLFIPRGELVNFAEGSATPAVTVRVGQDLTTDFWDFDFDRGLLVEGWNFLPLDFSDSTKETGSPSSSALAAARFQVNSTTAATLITDVRWDIFTIYDRGTAIPAEGAAGTVFKNTAVYKYRVTYVSKYGHESNAGPASVTLTLTAARNTLLLTGIPVSPDPQVIARKLYRTVNGGELNLFLDTINNNTDTTYTDETLDLGLGQTTPPLAGDLSDDNSPPPKAGIIKLWKRTVFIAGIPDRPQNIEFSDDDEPESFPTLNTVALDSKITAIYEAYSGLVIETEVGKWQVTGDNPDFKFDKVINNIGCVGRRAAGGARIDGWSVDREGMRLYDLSTPTKISEPIRDKFDDDFNKANIELMNTTHSKSRNAILMFVADSSGEYKGNNYIYQYPLDAVGNGWWWQLELPSSINPLEMEEIEDVNGTFKVYFSDDQGMVYELFADGEKNWTLANGSTEAIRTKFQTKYIRPASNPGDSEDYSGRIAPRMFEIRYDGDTPSTWTVTLETANGPDQPSPTDTQTIPMAFTTDESLLRFPCKQMQPGEYIRITVENNEIDVAGKINAIRLYFHPQPGQFPLETGQMVDQSP